MPKIWEVDFTSFSGVSDVALDNIGTQHLSSGITNIVKISPLPGFTFRPGLSFQSTEVENKYHLDVTLNSNARFTDNFNYRTFVMWYYSHGSWDARAPLWSNVLLSSNTVVQGWRQNISSTGLDYWINSALFTTYPGHFTSTTGWKFIAVSMDKLAVSTIVYGRSSGGNYTFSGASASNNTDIHTHVIGDNTTTRESSCSLGYVATYDEILSEVEIDSIYSAFLSDTTIGVPYATLSGSVFDLQGEPTTSGSPVYLLWSEEQKLVAKTTVSVGGAYTLPVPFPGDYVVVSNAGINGGAGALAMTAVSGGLVFT